MKEANEQFDCLEVETGLRPFIRSDCDGDGEVSGVSDAILLLRILFLGHTGLECVAACDADGSGEVEGEVTDAVFLLRHRFLGGAPPPAPFPDCGFGASVRAAELGCRRSGRAARSPDPSESQRATPPKSAPDTATSSKLGPKLRQDETRKPIKKSRKRRLVRTRFRRRSHPRELSDVERVVEQKSLGAETSLLGASRR